MILGLIWQLILRYQIGGTEDKSVKIALKKLLLIWLQHVIPEQRITNLTSDWNSGVALCNLINVLRPGLFPEYNHLNRDEKVANVAKGKILHKYSSFFGSFFKSSLTIFPFFVMDIYVCPYIFNSQG